MGKESSLEAGGELEVDAHAAVLAGIGGQVAGANRGGVLVEGDIEDGASGVKGDRGGAGRAASSDGSDAEDLDVLGIGSRGSRDGKSRHGGGARGEERGNGEETHLEGRLGVGGLGGG